MRKRVSRADEIQERRTDKSNGKVLRATDPRSISPYSRMLDRSIVEGISIGEMLRPLARPRSLVALMVGSVRSD